MVNYGSSILLHLFYMGHPAIYNMAYQLRGGGEPTHYLQTLNEACLQLIHRGSLAALDWYHIFREATFMRPQGIQI